MFPFFVLSSNVCSILDSDETVIGRREKTKLKIAEPPREKHTPCSELNRQDGLLLVLLLVSFIIAVRILFVVFRSRSLVGRGIFERLGRKFLFFLSL